MIRKIAFSVLIALASCHSGPGKKDASEADRPVEKFTPTKVRFAHGFNIEYHEGYKVLYIFNHQGEKVDTTEYVLLPRGGVRPVGHERAHVINIPVRSMAVLSSMHIALADFVGVTDEIVGLGNLQFIYSTTVRENVKAGKIKQVGIDGSLNNELLISLHPELLIAGANPEAGMSHYKTILDAGIPVVMNAEWLESTPLGRAEWVKVLAAFVNKEDSVNRRFDSVAAAYDKLVELAKTAKTKPSVIIGMPYKGTWYVPAGDSYVSHSLIDAGATYNYSNTPGVGSLALNFESVAPEALKAEFWLNIGFVDSKAEIASKDQRYTSFKPYVTGNTYNNTARTNDLGSNDYWESGFVRPEVVLADMISILHPELLPGYHLVYYKQLK